MKSIFFTVFIVGVAAFISMPFTYANDLITAETFNKYSEVAGFEKQYNQMINIFVSNFQNGMVQGFEESIKVKGVRADIKQKITPMVRQSAENIKSNFERLFKTEINFSDLVNSVYLPVYQKHFTEQEIIELIKFYKSPIGKKLSDLSPTIMQESSITFNHMYGIQVQKLGGEVVKKELDSLTQKLKSLQGN